MRRNHWILALAALALVATSHGRFLFPASAWLAPVVLVRFTRTAPSRWVLPGFVLIHTAGISIAYLDLVPLPLPAMVGMFVALSLVLGLLFLLDRRLARASDRLVTTAVLPCGWLAYDYASGLLSPNGSWGSIAYGLAGQTPVVQLASVTGWTGLTFLLVWCATTLNWAFDRRAAGQAYGRGLVALAVVLVAVVAFGTLRTSAASEGETVRFALLAGPDSFQGDHLEEVWRYTRGLELTQEQREAALGQIESRREHQLELTERALAEGARFAVWAEVNSAITSAQEPAWLERASEVARRQAGFVGLGLFVFRPDTDEPSQNRFVLFGPDGELVWDFYKATRVPGDGHQVGDGRLPAVPTELGLLSAAICFDMDFPQLFHQVGAAGVDVLIAPSNDWEEVRHVHADMAMLRAVEQGFNLVRPTKDGVALVSDPYGRVLEQLETVERGRDFVLVADVPTEGVRTLYSRIGDLFAQIACIGLALSLIAWRRL